MKNKGEKIMEKDFTSTEVMAGVSKLSEMDRYFLM